MKKFSLILTLCMLSIISYSQEYTKFMGISMDSDIVVFDKVFRADGIRFVTKRDFGEEFVYEYIGKYYNITDCCITINENKNNRRIKSISVLLPVEKNDTLTPKLSFAHIYQILNKEYKDVAVNKDEDNICDFSIQNYFVVYDKRILLRFFKFESGDMSDLNIGDVRYSPYLTYYPLP